MLVLSRKRDERILIGDNIVITVVDVRGDKVRLGIDAPKEVPVHREEVAQAIARQNELWYGRCPQCGARGHLRERRPNGNDTCVNGHVYPSASAIVGPPMMSPPPPPKR